MLHLAGHAFKESNEHKALKFCINNYPGDMLEDLNDFLQSYGYEILGTNERY